MLVLCTEEANRRRACVLRAHATCVAMSMADVMSKAISDCKAYGMYV